MNKLLLALLFFIQAAVPQFTFGQNMAVNTTGAAPDASAILDIASTNSGLLTPRMTTTQRNAIATPSNGLQIYNTVTNTIDVYRSSQWESVLFTNPPGNIVRVYSLADLPTPSGSSITLNAAKMYVFSGIINISPNYLVLNGAGLRGTDPAKDGVMSNVSGGVLRSTGFSVFIQDLAVIPISASTKAYDFADATGTKFCNIFSGSSVVEIGIPSLGVGQVSGFSAVTIEKNYWACKDGIKVTGTMGKFCSAYNFITGLTAGIGIEFLAGLTINDIDLSNNYFVYSGQIGVKVNAGSTIDRGRMTTNMFRGVGTLLSGFDSYTPEWEMRQNTLIPNSRAFCFTYMTNNTTATTLTTPGTFYKIAGTPTVSKQQKFTGSSNKLTYTGRENITSKISIVIGAKAPANSSDFSIAIAKNGVVILNPNGSMAASTNNQSFQITLITEVDMATNDYIEVFIRTNNNNTSTITVEEMQFRITD